MEILFLLFSMTWLVLSWVAFAILVGVFAVVRRNRGFFSWFVLALILSPLFAGILCAILKERPPLAPLTPAAKTARAVLGVALTLLVGYCVYNPTMTGLSMSAHDRLDQSCGDRPLGICRH